MCAPMSSHRSCRYGVPAGRHGSIRRGCRSTIDTTAYGAMVPLKRIAEPDDIVGPILFLLGPASRYMTGQTLWVNGGAYMP